MDEIICVKCDKAMQQGLLPRYEYEDGYTLHNVQAHICPKCNKTFFTEQQAKELKIRTQELKEYTFGFQRKIIISGKSLVLGIPSELAEHLNIKKGQTMNIVPIAKDGFMVRKS